MEKQRWLFFGFLIPLLIGLCGCSFVAPSLPTVTPTPASVTVDVYFTYLPNFQVGTEPYEKAVSRSVLSNVSLPEAVLTQLFQGPTPDEKAQGLDVFRNGATGFSRFALDSGIARVYLTGQCSSGGAAYTIANLINANLVQFPEIKWVKIYDENGETELPDGESGSIPFCLEP
jgi:hypothetical protein